MSDIPLFNDGDDLGEIRNTSLNPTISQTNTNITDIATLKGNALKVNGEETNSLLTGEGINTTVSAETTTLYVNNAITLWSIHEVGIGDSPYIIESTDQLGIEYQYSASSQSTQSMMLNTSDLPDGSQVKVTVVGVESNSKPISVTQLRQGGDFTWLVSTPTVFTLRGGLWRVEDSSQLLHIQGATTFDDASAVKTVVHGVASDPTGSITMSVNSDGVLLVGGGNSGGSGDTYTGQGVGVSGETYIGGTTNEFLQSELVMCWKNSDVYGGKDANIRLIQVDGNTEFQVICDTTGMSQRRFNIYAGAARTSRTVLRDSTSILRAKIDWVNVSNSYFYWHDLAISNLKEIDSAAQETRFGLGAVLAQDVNLFI